MTPASKYFRWDFDNSEVVQYERKGECNGCGACCKALIQFRVRNISSKRLKDGRDLGNATDGKGVWAQIKKGKKRRTFQVTHIVPGEVTCSSLSPENKCMVHLDKPTICEVWPVLPEQVTPFKECSYTFEEIGRWPIPPSGE